MTLQRELALSSEAIQGYLDTVFETAPDLPLSRAMRYGLQGGKAIRGFLVLQSAALYEINAEHALPVAAGVEAMHAYSLIHDDLPAMDDDDLRRGRPTVHRAWDEATAVLAGDALQALGFELVLSTADATAARALALGLSRAAGIAGMVGGQALDIAAETAQHPLTLERIVALQAGKTGALIRWSATAGAVMASADTAPLARYGDALGLAFQIADDILDVEGSEAEAGKKLRKDGDAGKATFVSLLGLDGAKVRAGELVAEAQDALSDFGPKADTLRDLAGFVIARKK